MDYATHITFHTHGSSARSLIWWIFSPCTIMVYRRKINRGFCFDLVNSHDGPWQLKHATATSQAHHSAVKSTGSDHRPVRSVVEQHGRTCCELTRQTRSTSMELFLGTNSVDGFYSCRIPEQYSTDAQLIIRRIGSDDNQPATFAQHMTIFTIKWKFVTVRRLNFF
jgi:hypothetical protein